MRRYYGGGQVIKKPNKTKVPASNESEALLQKGALSTPENIRAAKQATKSKPKPPKK